MTITHFSDTHGRHRDLKVPDSDVVIFSGDACNGGYRHEIEDFLDWWVKLPNTYKIFVPGNHDICLDKQKYDKRILPLEIDAIIANYISDEDFHFYLNQSSCNIWGVNFFGSGYVPVINSGKPTRWAFSLERDALNEKWADIPKNTDILVTHGPPYCKLDYTIHKTYVGDERLRWYVKSVAPSAHLFGHIHEDYGIAYNQNTYFFNGSAVAGNYEIKNKPHEFEIDVYTKEITLI